MKIKCTDGLMCHKRETKQDMSDIISDSYFNLCVECKSIID